MASLPRVASAVTLLIAAIPAVFAALWVHRYGVDVPWKDDWDSAGLVVKAHTGTLAWSDLFQQQQEARYVLPKLLFIASSAGGHWDVRRLMVGSVGVCVLTALGLFWLLGKAGLAGLTKAFCFWLMALLVFSAAQYELWPWASGLPCFLVPFFLVAALCLSEAQFSTAAKFASCALLAITASFTLPQGLLLWPLTFPIVLLRGGNSKWPRWFGAWVVLGAVFGWVYFNGYVRPAQAPEFAPAIPMLSYVRYFFAFLGGEFAYATRDHRIFVSAATGLLLFALYLAVMVRPLLRRNDRELRRRLLPWFALGAFAIGAATLTSLGRIGFGIDSAISSRYVASSLYLSVAVVALVAISAKDIALRHRITFLAPGFYVLCLLLGGAFLTLYAFASARSVRLMEGTAVKTRLARAGVLFSQVLETSTVIQPALYFDPAWVKDYAAKLDELKLLRPPLVRERDLAPIASAIANAEVAGEWEEFVVSPNERSRAAGWTFLNDKGRPADAVILADESGQGLSAFALENEVRRRRDPQTRMLDWSGWGVSFPSNAVPEKAKLSAWALDAEGPKLYRLRQTAAERNGE